MKSSIHVDPHNYDILSYHKNQCHCSHSLGSVDDRIYIIAAFELSLTPKNVKELHLTFITW